MNSKLRLILFFLLSSNTVFAQVEIRGRVLDSILLKPLTGASIQIGNKYRTLTDKNGFFTLRINKSNSADTVTLKVAYIGYKTASIPLKKIINNQNVLLQYSIQNLNEVVVSAQGESIIKRAIKRIPENYPVKPIIIKGLMRIHSNINDTDYFYVSSAIAKVYAASYNKGMKQQVKIEQNKTTELKNPKSIYYDVAPVSWVDGFTSIDDMVYNRDMFLNEASIDDYFFYDKGKILFNNRRTYVIDFEKKRNNKIEGTVYIDSASLAFVEIAVSKFNVKELLFETKSFEQLNVAYTMIGDKWYLQRSLEEAVYKKRFEGKEKAEFTALAYDTVAAEKFPQTEIIQRLDKNSEIKKTVPDSLWLPYDSLFLKKEKQGELTVFDMPAIDTTAKRKKYILGTVIKYMGSNNVRAEISVERFPFSTVNTRYSDIAAYGLGYSLWFRLYKGIFLSIGSQQSYGLGGLHTTLSSYSLNYEYLFNKQKRRKALSPFIGFSKTDIYDKEIDTKQRLNSLLAGFNYAIELSHHKSFFIGFSYINQIGNEDRFLNIKPNNFSFRIGLAIKF